MPTYNYGDFMEMAKCYKQCGNINKTRILYNKKYGKYPSYGIVRKALTVIGVADKCQSNNSSDSIEIKKELTDEITIKEEIDDEITIKEEIEDTFLEDSVMGEKNSLKELDLDLNRCLLVYTTRLDDMQVFNKEFNSMSVQTIVDNILCESKPQLCKSLQSVLQIGRDIEMDMNSFNNVLDKVKEYNHITTYVDFGADACEIDDLFLIQEEASSERCLTDRSNELLKLCKPLSITLTDINKANQFPIFITEISEFTHTHKDTPFIRNTYFMVEDRYLNSTDIFFLNDKCVPTNLYHLNCIVSENSDLPVYKYFQNRYNVWRRKVYKVANCCWYKRETNIEFIANKFFGSNSTSLMKKPHLCALSKCVCCCKTDASHKSRLVKIKQEVKTSEGESSSDVKNQINESTGWLIRSLKLKTNRYYLDIDIWFDQAVRNIVNSTKIFCRNALPNTSARLFIITQGTNVRLNSGDRFELGQGDKINLYIHSPAENTGVKGADACCWRKKKSIISGLGYSAHVKNFIKMPHTCYPYNCFCCCSDTDISKRRKILPLRDIKLPKQPDYTKNYSSPFVLTGKSHVNDVNFTHAPNILQHTKVTKPPKSVKTDLTTQPGLKVPLVPPQSSNIPDLSEDPTVNTLINSILERFKDIRLAINAEGKVFAELNTAIDTLSIDELKVLSNILGRVQEQVNLLGLAGNPYLQNIIRTHTTALTMPVNNNYNKDAETNTSLLNNQDTTTNVTKNSKTLEKLNNNILPTYIFNELNSQNCALNLPSNTPNYTDSDNSKTNIATNPQIKKPQERQNLYQNLDIELNTCLNTYISYKTLMKWKYQQYKESFKSFISGHKEEGTPIIENVYSLTGVKETTKNKDLLIDICSDDAFTNPKPGPSGVRSWVNDESNELRPGPSGVSSKVNNDSRELKPGSSRKRSGVKRNISNNDKQSNKKLKIKSLRELLSETPRVPQATPPLAAIGSPQLLHQELQAPPMLGGHIITPFIVNNQFASDLPVQSHNKFVDQELQTPSILSGNIVTPINPPLIINNQLGSQLAAQSHNNFANMSSQLPALMPFNNPVIITNAVNLHVPTPEKTNDECILGV